MTGMRVVPAVVLLILAAGCAPRMAPPPAFADFATNLQVARLLSAGCPSIGLDQSAVGMGARDLGVALRAEGFTQDDISAFPDTLDTSAIEARTRAYLAGNGVDPGDSASVCATARAEIGRDSAIGAFLTAG